MATLREIIDNSNYAVFFGGAGVSTASNIPDFRGKNGIYNTENEWGLPPEIIISHTFFTRRTKDFYDYYKKYMVYPSAVPNAVHIALARLEKEGKIKAVLTQNIDGLHQAAGSKNVYELHGSVHRNYCTRCGKFYDLDYILDDVWQGAWEEVRRADTLIVGGSSLTVYPAAGLVDMFYGKNLCIINATPTPFDRRATYLSHESLTREFENL